MSSEKPAHARVTRVFRAPPERLFDAWLDPELLGTWMFGPAVRDEEIVRIALDPRPGGAFSFVVRRQGQEIEHVGEYLEIDRPRRLAFSWSVKQDNAEAARIIVEIIPHAPEGTALTLTHELPPSWASFVSQAETSWSTMLASLAAALNEA